MSMYFDVGGETLWNPSSGAGRLFVRQVEVFEAEIGLPSGIGQGKYWGDPDTLEVDPVAFAEFVRGLVVWHCGTGHSVILALSEGFVAVSVALARRAGIEVELPRPESGHVCGGVRHDVQVPGRPPAESAAVVASLDARVREMDRSMAR
ncbi:DUF6086 family protein [Streptomyces mesophilus]|uniref:DUF6086 family protein n=1 Tax=Streptomyces mesophilus TaxID=1775132 RepID=UPI00332219DC